MINNSFAIFICTHGRPNAQYTYNMLRECGYTGKIWLVVDDTDNTIQEYINNYGAENIIVFNKNHFINNSDTGTNELQAKCILYAKNAVEYIANKLKLSSFAIADDDIKSLCIRYKDEVKLRRYTITKNLDSYIEAYLEYLERAKLAVLGFGIGGNYFSGVDSFKSENLERLRIVYQFVLRNAEYKVDWKGWYAEDSITALLSQVNQVWLIHPGIMQTTTIIGKDSDVGGMHDTYIQNDSLKLCKSTMKFCPAIIKPYLYKGKYILRIDRANAFPKIISERWKI